MCQPEVPRCRQHSRGGARESHHPGRRRPAAMARNAGKPEGGPAQAVMVISEVTDPALNEDIADRAATAGFEQLLPEYSPRTAAAGAEREAAMRPDAALEEGRALEEDPPTPCAGSAAPGYGGRIGTVGF